MDDEDELKDFNLSSRVEREERRRQRERGRLERELERERARDRGEASFDATGSSRDWGPSEGGAQRSGDAADGEATPSAASPRPGGASGRGPDTAGVGFSTDRRRNGNGGYARGSGGSKGSLRDSLHDGWVTTSANRGSVPEADRPRSWCVIGYSASFRKKIKKTYTLLSQALATGVRGIVSESGDHCSEPCG